MNQTSQEYFAANASRWDSLRASYFSEAVRTAAIQKAYLRPEMQVADIGAGTGFISAGLAPLVQRVYAVDASPQMLDVARSSLQNYSNVVYEHADGQSIPLPDASQDAVFANMYLHHCPEPLAAIREMARLLKPGGRLVISDMDAHPYAWMKEEMADVWQGFERDQIHAWLEQAGLVNVLVDCSGECCSSHPSDAAADEAQVSIFVAAGAKRLSGAQGAVRDHYAAIALSSGSCCAPAPQTLSQDSGSCCSPSPLISLESLDAVHFETGYAPQQSAGAPQEAVEFSLGCGNPTAMANLRPGEVVLDIGSGGGIDAFLAARQVGLTGRVIGVDMTPEMLRRARASAQKAGLSQVEFRQGQAEALPVEDASVDVILSNCVINLSEDKGRVFREAFRVLKPGGRLEISDMVTDGVFPPQLRLEPQNWGGCVFGALPEQEYLDLIAYAGGEDIHKWKQVPAGVVAGVKLSSITLRAVKPM